MDTTKTAHTPGPWKVLDRGIVSDKINAYGNFVVLIMPDRDEPTGEDEANARLIAAAPDLLKTLADIVTEFGRPDYPKHSGMSLVLLDQARAAIAKAEGNA